MSSLANFLRKKMHATQTGDKTRYKRSQDPGNWKCNVAKRQREPPGRLTGEWGSQDESSWSRSEGSRGTFARKQTDKISVELKYFQKRLKLLAKFGALK